MANFTLDEVTFDSQDLELKKEIAERPFIDFTQVPAFGMWADREDIGDSTEYVRKLRKEQWTRNRD